MPPQSETGVAICAPAARTGRSGAGGRAAPSRTSGSGRRRTHPSCRRRAPEVQGVPERNPGGLQFSSEFRARCSGTLHFRPEVRQSELGGSAIQARRFHQASPGVRQFGPGGSAIP
eukprot:4858359-Alexandrium_andersonii.AAC.1